MLEREVLGRQVIGVTDVHDRVRLGLGVRVRRVQHRVDGGDRAAASSPRGGAGLRTGTPRASRAGSSDGVVRVVLVFLLADRLGAGDRPGGQSRRRGRRDELRRRRARSPRPGPRRRRRAGRRTGCCRCRSRCRSAARPRRPARRPPRGSARGRPRPGRPRSTASNGSLNPAPAAAERTPPGCAGRGRTAARSTYGAATIIPSVLGWKSASVALVRVQPDDPVTQPRQPLDRGGEHRRVAAVQAVGADHHDAAATQPAPAPVPDERRRATHRSGCRPPSRRPPPPPGPARRPAGGARARG